MLGSSERSLNSMFIVLVPEKGMQKIYSTSDQ